MSMDFGQPQQHKQPSRKGKKAWRKNVDITDVQSGLELLREEIIQGGPITEKKSEDLFAVDILGSEDIKKNFKLQKPLKADEILAKRSLVPGVDSRKRPSSRVTDGILEPSSKRQKGDWVSKKEVQRLMQVANTTSHLQDNGEEPQSFDLWAMAPSVAQTTKELDYIPQTKPKVAPASIKKSPTPMTASGKPVRAVKNPVAGTSYNPSFEDWDDLLNQEGAKELAAEQTRIREAELQLEKQARIAAASKDNVGMRTDDESGWEGFETEPDESELLKKKRPQRKTPVQRNKLKRRKEAERLAKHERRMADKEKQVAQFIAASSTIAKRPDGTVAVVINEYNGNDQDVDDGKLRRRRIGNAPIPEKRLELVLPDELQESLRQLKPEGNLLQDRFRNLLVNGKIESRKPVVAPKKKKTKLTEKWSHKDFSVVV